MWGSAEIWLAFWLLDRPIAVAEAVVLESLGQAMRSVGFVLPGGLGAQESAIVAAGTMVGIAPDLALAVALIKRARVGLRRFRPDRVVGGRCGGPPSLQADPAAGDLMHVGSPVAPSPQRCYCVNETVNLPSAAPASA
ncbi:MAG TPA: hypothetical protein VHK45_01960 [Geminicoccaceae bacterium]|nr:hypothetical protein [Geminicoccaceae bacterium]